jgi:hypothetical protein
MTTFASKIGLAGRKNFGGMMHDMFFAPVDKFANIAVPVTNTDPDNIVITSAHTFVQGPPVEGFSTLQCSYDNVSLEGEGSEEPDSDGQRYMIKGFLPGNYDDLHKEVKKMKTQRFILLIPDRNGKVMQFGGGLTDYVILKNFKFTTNQFLGKKGFELTFQCDAETPYFYEGAITLKP